MHSCQLSEYAPDHHSSLPTASLTGAELSGFSQKDRSQSADPAQRRFRHEPVAPGSEDHLQRTRCADLAM